MAPTAGVVPPHTQPATASSMSGVRPRLASMASALPAAPMPMVMPPSGEMVMPVVERTSTVALLVLNPTLENWTMMLFACAMFRNWK